AVVQFAPQEGLGRMYVDHAATSPCGRRVLSAMFPSSRKSGATRRVCAAPDDVPRGHDDRMTLGVTGGVTSRPYAGARRRGTVGPRAVGSGRARRKGISTVAAVVRLGLSACGGPARTPPPAPATPAP